MQHGDAGPRAFLEFVHASDLEGQRILDRRCGNALLELLACHAVHRQFLKRQVHPTPVEILTDVADEVGKLERDAEVGCAVVRLRRCRLQDRDHLQSDDGRGSVDVLIEIVERLVLGNGEIHRHRVQEGLEVRLRDLPAQHRVDDRAADGII